MASGAIARHIQSCAYSVPPCRSFVAGAYARNQAFVCKLSKFRLVSQAALSILSMDSREFSSVDQPVDDNKFVTVVIS